MKKVNLNRRRLMNIKIKLNLFKNNNYNCKRANI